ncbi:MAG: trypsin-like peptidase domain-containing protein [Pseudobacteriovorax sp.]|nr:trypsin-like peptidase domain-containing protein [Pseudobacteriovorax sp.]
MLQSIIRPVLALSIFVYLVGLTSKAFALAPLVSKEDGDQWRSIGRLSGSLACTGFLIDLQQGDNNPAQVLTNGHCVRDFGRTQTMSEVIMDLDIRGLGYSITFDFFYDQSVKTEFPIARISYATMKSVDLAVLELDVSLLELKELGIKPLYLSGRQMFEREPVKVVGAPIFSDDGLDYLRLAECEYIGTSDVLEWNWFWSNSIVTDCSSIAEGSSGSPIIDSYGNVIGMINTSTATAKSTETCYLGHPCEVMVTGTEMVKNRSYGPKLFAIQGCFVRGRFDVYQSGCQLDPGSPVEVTMAVPTPHNGRPSVFDDPVWSIQMQGLTQGFYYKSGPIQLVDCQSDDGYSDLQPARSNILDLLPLPDETGAFVTCIRLAQLENSRSFDFPIVVPVVIDRTGPDEMPIASLLRRGAESIWFEPLFSVPELSGYLFQVTDDPSDPCDVDLMRFYIRIPITLDVNDLPTKVCIQTEDNAGNLGLVWEYVVESVMVQDRYQLSPVRAL